MSVSRKIHFNALPEEVRQRFVDRITGEEKPGPLYRDPAPSGVGGLVFWLLVGLAGLAILCSYGYGSLWGDGGFQGIGSLVLYVGGSAVAVASLLSILRRIKLHRALPFRPGRYLFALEFVDARSEVLELWPISQCVDFNGTHHHNNGSYTHTTFVFHFEGGHRESFNIPSREMAEELLQQLGTIQGLISEAGGRLGRGEGEDKDVGILYAFDPFFSARMSEEWAGLSTEAPSNPSGEAVAEPLPSYLTRVSLMAVIVGLGIGLSTWMVRNALSDSVRWTTAQSEPGAAAMDAYLYQGGWHEEEARTLFIERTFHEVLASRSVTQMRNFIRQYPDYEGAEEALHGLYMGALAAFEAQANQADPKLVPFVRALVANLEATATTGVDVRFTRPSEEILRDIDTQVSQAGGRIDGIQVAPIGPHFAAQSATMRERAILKSLQQGFGAVFPQDIMELSYVESMGDGGGNSGDIERPTIDVLYNIAASGSLYSGETRDRAYIGIAVQFSVRMRVPGHSDELDLTLTVEPPSTFTVQSSYMAFAGAATPGPDDDLVYQVMAARAFDHLSEKLRLAIFNPESAAFKKAKEALEPETAAQ